MENVTIARIDNTKAENFFELYKAITEADFNNWPREIKDRWYSVDYSLGYWEDILAEGELPIFVAFNNITMLGYVVLKNINFGVGHIGWVGVLKEFQGKGIGKQLLNTIEEWAKENGIHKLELEVQEPKLQAFYKKQGYVLEGIRRNSWQHLDNYMFGKVL